MMNKKGMQFKNLFFAVVAIGLVITAVGTTLSEWDDVYSSGVSSDLTGYNRIDDISLEAEKQQDAFGFDDSDPGSNDAETSTYRGVFAVISNIFSPFRVIFGDNGMIDDITERYNLPDIYRQAFVTMLIIAITTAMIAVIFRLNRSSA